MVLLANLISNSDIFPHSKKILIFFIREWGSVLLSERIRELREQKNISQKQLADIMHISQSSISEYESGNQQPPLEMIVKLADFFDVSTDYLLGQTNIAISMNRLKEKISTRVGEIPLDKLFSLKDNEKEIIALMINALSNNRKK